MTSHCRPLIHASLGYDFSEDCLHLNGRFILLYITSGCLQRVDVLSATHVLPFHSAVPPPRDCDRSACQLVKELKNYIHRFSSEETTSSCYNRFHS